MDKLINDPKLLKTEVKTAGFGTITFLKNKNGISHQSQAAHAGGTVIASYVYDKDETYELVYTHLDGTGNVLGNYEEIGILPTLFHSPSGQLWVSVVVHHPNKEQEVTIPVFERENFTMPKPGRPFTGDFVGTTDNTSLFLDIEFYPGKKPDKLILLEFESGTIKKKRDVKLEMPRNNKVFINGREIHLLAFENEQLRHRQIDADGKVLSSRMIAIPDLNDVRPLHLSFSGSSKILGYWDDRFLLLAVDAKGIATTTELLSVGSDIFSTWSPEKIDANTLLFRFTTEEGNGWLVMREDRVVECFVHEAKKGYVDRISKKKLEFGHDELTLSGATKTSEKSYAITLYPATDDSPQELIILNRKFE